MRACSKVVAFGDRRHVGLSRNDVHHAWLWRSNGGSLTPVDHTMSYHQLPRNHETCIFIDPYFQPSLTMIEYYHRYESHPFHQPPLTIDWTRMASLPIIYDRKPGFTSLDGPVPSNHYLIGINHHSHTAIVSINHHSHHSPAIDRYLPSFYCGYQPVCTQSGYLAMIGTSRTHS